MICYVREDWNTHIWVNITFFALNVFIWNSVCVLLKHSNISLGCDRQCSLHFYARNQFSSVAQLCLTLCNPMDCSMPGLPVHHQLLEFMQTHVLQVGDAIQPSHPLSSPSLPAFKLSQHQGLFKWLSSLHQVANVFGVSAWVLSVNTQDWSPLGWTGWISLQSKGLSRVFSNTIVQKHRFFAAQLSL